MRTSKGFLPVYSMDRGDGEGILQSSWPAAWRLFITFTEEATEDAAATRGIFAFRSTAIDGW